MWEKIAETGDSVTLHQKECKHSIAVESVCSEHRRSESAAEMHVRSTDCRQCFLAGRRSVCMSPEDACSKLHYSTAFIASSRLDLGALCVAQPVQNGACHSRCTYRWRHICCIAVEQFHSLMQNLGFLQPLVSGHFLSTDFSPLCGGKPD